MEGFIYKYTFPNGKVYIGQTRRPLELRHKEHINPKTGPLNRSFWKAYVKFGTAELTVLEVINATSSIELVKTLNEREAFFIKQYDSTNPDYGYNEKAAGTSYSPDRLILLSECQELCKERSSRIFGLYDSIFDKIAGDRENTLTEEEKTLIRNTLLNKNPFADTLKDFIDSASFALIDKNDDKLFWIAEAIDFAKSCWEDDIRNVVCSHIAENSTNIIARHKRSIAIQQIDSNGSVIREYLDADEIRKEFNIKRIDNITNVLKGHQKTAYGYYWRYKTN